MSGEQAQCQATLMRFGALGSLAVFCDNTYLGMKHLLLISACLLCVHCGTNARRGGTMASAPAGVLDGPCNSVGTCNAGLLCVAAICVLDDGAPMAGAMGMGAGSTGGAAAGSSAGVMGGTGVTDSLLFVPDVPLTYDGAVIEPGVEILAFTIAEGSLGPVWLVAFENVSTDLRLCGLRLPFLFFDAAGTQIARAGGVLNVPLSRGSSGAGGILPCLLPGEIGMAVNTYDLGNTDVDAIASITWSVDALNLYDAVSTNDIVVTGLGLVKDEFDRDTFAGTIENNTGYSVMNPDISVFGLNEVGRPLLEGHEYESTTLAAGASWNFVTRPGFDQPIASFVAFPQVDDI